MTNIYSMQNVVNKRTLSIPHTIMHRYQNTSRRQAATGTINKDALLPLKPAIERR